MAIYTDKSRTRILEGTITEFKSVNGISHGVVDVEIELDAGENIITIQGIDNAGNFSESSDELTVLFDVDTMLNNFIRRSKIDHYSTTTVRRQYYLGQLSSITINASTSEIRVEQERLANLMDVIRSRLEQIYSEHPLFTRSAATSTIGSTGYTETLLESGLDYTLSPTMVIDALYDQYSDIERSDYILRTFEYGSTLNGAPDVAGLGWDNGYYIGQTSTVHGIVDANMYIRPSDTLLAELRSDFKQATLVLYCQQTKTDDEQPVKVIRVDALNVPVTSATDPTAVYWGWDTNGITLNGTNENTLLNLLWDTEVTNITKTVFNPTHAPVQDPIRSMREDNYIYDIYDGTLTRIELDITEALRYLVAGTQVLNKLKLQYPVLLADFTIPRGLNGLRLSSPGNKAIQVFTDIAVPFIKVEL
jgi:hypothetical protein